MTASHPSYMLHLSTKKCDIEHAELHKRRIARLERKRVREDLASKKDDLLKARRKVKNFQARLVRAVFRNQDVDRVEAVLGYSIESLRLHLERQFLPGMRWDNHISQISGASFRDGWHIDHIVPKSRLLSIPEAYAITNLRPLWGVDNIKKGFQRTHLV